MQLIRITALAALLLQLPTMAMAEEAVINTMKSLSAKSLACTTGINTAIAGFDATKSSDKLKQAMLTGANLDQLTTGERSYYTELQTTSATCAQATTMHQALLNELTAILSAGKALPVEARTEFNKMDAAFKAANEAMSQASKVAVFAHVLHRTGSGQ